MRRDETRICVRKGSMARARSSAWCDRRMVGGETGRGRIDLDLADPLAMPRRSRSLGDRGSGPRILRPRSLRMGHRPGPDACCFGPATLQETCWAIEQCLRCPGVSVTCGVHREAADRRPCIAAGKWRRKSAAAWACCFVPDEARREPVWADLRLRVTPLSGGQGDARRIRIDVLYRRGGLGGSAQVWEIDHAAGDVRLVPEVANPAAAERAARA